MKRFKTLLSLLGFCAAVALSYFIISDVEKVMHHTAPTPLALVYESSPPQPLPTIQPMMPMARPQEALLFYAEEIEEYIPETEYYPLPMWLYYGLNEYKSPSGDLVLLSNEDLALWLQQGPEDLPFGDAWLVPSLRPRAIAKDDILNAAYTIVRLWSMAEELEDLVSLAETDTRAFAAIFNSYIAELAGETTVPYLHFIYKSGDFEVLTTYGSFVFVDDNYQWAWPRVNNFIYYMDSAIGFVRSHFDIQNADYIRVTLYPFGVINIPDSIAEMAEMFDWDAPEVNFVADDKIVLASTSRFGTWAFSHEVTHILLFREFPYYRPPTWMLEGMAVLGEMLFRYAFEGTRTYRFTVPTVANINTMARNGNGHRLPLHYYEYMFGRDRWTYDDAGSFVLYLYNNFGIEALLEMYKSDYYSQFEMALEIFGTQLEELMYSWRDSLWPNGEPEGWWRS